MEKVVDCCGGDPEEGNRGSNGPRRIMRLGERGSRSRLCVDGVSPLGFGSWYSYFGSCVHAESSSHASDISEYVAFP